MLREEIAAGEALLVAAVEGLLRSRDDVDVPDPTVAAYLVVHLVEAITHRFVLHPPADADAARFIDEVVLLLSRYLSPPAKVVPRAGAVA